jgi:hypothetical protein
MSDFRESKDFIELASTLLESVRLDFDTFGWLLEDVWDCVWREINANSQLRALGADVEQFILGCGSDLGGLE